MKGWLTSFLVAATTFAAPETSLVITSSGFKPGESIPAQYTCAGANTHPALHIGNTPAATKSLAISVTDPDAPSGTFTHWLVWNIDPKTSDVAEAKLPAGALEGTNDFGKRGYGGPCPPSGTHRYYFRVFALDTTLDLKAGAKASEFNQAIAGHVLARGELMGRFSH